ncbi:MAG: beta-propeller domain-containing protein [Firmicutes bacterium]|nr:beta-propeller domain-containing protein [Bacillota bacterium]
MDNKFKDTFDKIKDDDQLKKSIKSQIDSQSQTTLKAVHMSNHANKPKQKQRLPLSTKIVRFSSLATVCMMALIIGLGFGFGWFVPAPNLDIRNYGTVLGVQSLNPLSRDQYIDLVWIENDIDWETQDRNDLAVSDGGEADRNTSTAQSPDSDGSDYTVTNSQVEGVQEGDIIQADSNHIYFLSRTGLNIVSARGQMRLLYRDELNDFLPDEMYIFGNRLIVIGGYYSSVSMNVGLGHGPTRLWGNRLATRIIVYDISNTSNVKRLFEHSVSGSFITSRRIGNNLIVTTNFFINRLRQDRIFPTVNGQELNSQYIHFHDTLNFSSLLVLASLNLDTLQMSVAAHMGLNVGHNSSAQYFSKENVYFLVGLNKACQQSGNRTNYSFVSKISLTTLKTIANTTIDGHVNSRFWVSEYGDNFRIISQSFTSGIGNLGRHTNLYILDNDLNVVNNVRNIQRGRTIHGVRFRGNQVAIDTYILIHIRIDGVATIDLTDINNPIITEGGAADGTNEYLQWLSDDVVIGLGQNTQTNNNFTSFHGVMVSLYGKDGTGVLQPANQITLGTHWAFSEALSNPRVIVNDTARNMFSIPITKSLPSFWDGRVNRPRIEGQGLAVFEYSLNKEGNHTLKFRGLLSNLPQNHTFADWDDLNYHSFSFVQRGARVGDRLFTVSDRYITSYCVRTLNQIGQLKLRLNMCSLLGCNIQGGIRRDATCTTDGLWRGRCSRCRQLRSFTMPAWGAHRFGEWSITTLPSANMSGGQESRECNGCGVRETRRLQNHSYTSGFILRRDLINNTYSVQAFRGSGSSVTIPNYHNNIPIVKIETNAFNFSRNINTTNNTLTCVTIGKNIQIIGDNAFGGQLRISSLTIEDGSRLTSIGNSAFANTSISSLVLPDSLVSIGNSAFLNVINITSLSIPKSVEHIGANAFASNRWMSSQIVLSSLNSVVFEDGSSLVNIGASAFANTSLTAITIPKSVVSIGAGAFSIATNANRQPQLTSLIFEKGSFIKTIGASAFANTRIKSVVLPQKLQSVSDGLFLNVISLQSVVFDGGGKYVEFIGNSAFENTDLECINIPLNVQSIGANAFRGIGRLSKIVVPDTVNAIHSGAFSHMASLTCLHISANISFIGQGIFSFNPFLKNVTMTDNYYY